MPTIQSARLWYSTSDPVHGFDHVLRVYRLAEHIAISEGADLEIVRAAALLHDVEFNQVSGIGDQGRDQAELQRENHHHISADFAVQILRQEGWAEERISAVQHCIRAHRFRDEKEQPHTLEARVLFDADKLDAIGAVGVTRAIAFALQAGQPVYASPSQGFFKTGQLEPGEAHSAYHEYIYKLRKLKARLFTPAARHLAEDRHKLMHTFFEALAAEMRGDHVNTDPKDF